ncbi:hypothetical protein TNCV_2074061 [Trichonephila clavipes]|nr:hypothetical protein TNCV_2074061 [Trichonephila clavipes]
MGLPEPPGGWTSTCWSAEGILYFPVYHQWKPLKAFPYPPPGDALSRGESLPHRYKKTLIVDFDCSRNLTSIIARLRTGHFKGMKISSDKTRTYIPFKNCTEAQLTPDHILECPALTPHIIRLGMVPLASELHEVLYSADAPRLAEAVQRAHDII